MKTAIIAALALAIISGNAYAGCVGTATFSTCSDSSGNHYNVTRFGNQTQVYGSNPSTGSQWNETVTHYGNTTNYQGNTNGQPWNMREQDFGNGMRSYNGVDSSGRSFSHLCNTYTGCN